MKKKDAIQFYQSKTPQTIEPTKLLHVLERMLLIRHFEMRAKAAYQQGYIGGFFHAYTGQEAIQVGALEALGIEKHWWITTYRCHALALLLGATPNSVMAELYGKSSGNARGRGGSMHLYGDRLLGGFGIVGGHIPIATGAGFSLKYQNNGGIAICFLGDGAVAQGGFHESLNLASLWNLPCMYVIENNGWGMGTSVHRAICVQPIAEHMAKSYNMKAYTLDGMDFFNCYAGFCDIYNEMLQNKRPVLVEAIAERFEGHSISDPGLYRSKEAINAMKKRDPIRLLIEKLKQTSTVTDREIEAIDNRQKEIVLAAMDYANQEPWPDPITLEEDVFAP